MGPVYTLCIRVVVSFVEKLKDHSQGRVFSGFVRLVICLASNRDASVYVLLRHFVGGGSEPLVLFDSRQLTEIPK